MSILYAGKRITSALAAAAALVVLGSAPAWAHVEVEADHAQAGATDVILTFHVPNEEAPAATTRITILLPQDHPLIGVSATAQNGFRPTLTTRHLAPPLQASSGAVRDVATAVTFSEGRITGHDEKAFDLHVDQLPSDASTLTFKVLQQYSTGSSVAWVDVAADGNAEPEHPAPVLRLAAASPASTPSATAAPAAPASARPITVSAAPRHLAGASHAAGVVVAVVLALAAAVSILMVRLRRPRNGRSGPASLS
ncbi:MAG: YcnI family protein [Oryzihumus sp.]